MRRIYLDNAATTQVLPCAVEAMLPYYTTLYGNPGGYHSFAREAHAGLDAARRTVADCIGAQPGEIVFTGGGSEGDNMILRGVAHAYRKKGRHIITTAIEHHAILHTLLAMQAEGLADVTILPVDSYGVVTARQVQEAIRPDTILVSVMHANNEVGSVEPVAEIGSVCRKAGVLLHTDAVQSVGHIPVNVKTLQVDLLTMAAHKFHGPKGVGAIFVRKGVRLPALIEGGSQENNRRAGTENIPGAVGLATALQYQTEHLEEHMAKIGALRKRLILDLTTRIEGVTLNGHPTMRLPNNVNICIEGVQSESVLLRLDQRGIAAAAGAACAAGALDPSHVLLAMGVPTAAARGALRLTMSAQTTAAELEYTVEALHNIVQALRFVN